MADLVYESDLPIVTNQQWQAYTKASGSYQAIRTIK